MSYKRYIHIFLTLAVLCFGLTGFAEEQPPPGGSTSAGDAFTFVRIRYDNAGGGLDSEWGWSSWSIDYPAADFNFLRGVTRPARCDAADQHSHQQQSGSPAAG